MKSLKFISLALCAVLMAACAGKNGAPATEGTAEGSEVKESQHKPMAFRKGEIDSCAIAIGQNLALMFTQPQLKDLDVKLVAKALIEKAKEVTAPNFPDSLLEKINMETNTYIRNYMAKQEAVKGDQNLVAGQKFLEENKTKEGVVETESGLQYKIIEPGSDVHPSAVDTVEVNYRLSSIEGKEIESSYSHGQTAKFPLNAVIKGWTEGLQLIGEGGKIMLYVPSTLAYGKNGGPLGPNATLVFETELVKVHKFIEPKEIKK